MMVSLTPRQADLLQFIRGHLLARGYSPSFSEMAGALGISGNKGGVARLVAGLEERGAIRRLHGRARAIEVLTPSPVSRAPDGAPLYFVPILRQAQDERVVGG